MTWRFGCAVLVGFAALAVIAIRWDAKTEDADGVKALVRKNRNPRIGMLAKLHRIKRRGDRETKVYREAKR